MRNEEFPWVSALVILAALVIIFVGGGAAILNESYSMEEYFRDLSRISIGLGLLGIGRGIRSGLIRRE
jgi:hypothetical protein